MKKFLQTSLTAFFIFYSALFYGQNHEIKGTVTTENGTPLEFVTITVKETKSNSITDSSGSFTINTTTNATKLIISLFGYETIEVDAKENAITIQLALNNNSLDEIVIVGSRNPKKKQTGNGGSCRCCKFI